MTRPERRLREQRWDVMGVLAAARQLDGYRTAPSSIAMTRVPEAGMQDPMFRVGPAILQLADGRELFVPAGTPGSNASMHLLTEDNRVALTGADPSRRVSDADVRSGAGGVLAEPAIVIASLSSQSEVERFSITSADVAGHAEVGAVVEWIDDEVLTSSGYRFRVSPHVEVSPWLLDGGYEHSPSEARVEVTTGEVVGIIGLMVD